METLDVSCNRLGEDYTSNDIKGAFAAAIGQATNLTELDISSNHLNAEDAKIIAPAIHDNGALSQLDISGNNFGNEEKASIKHTCAEKSITCVC